MHEVSFEETLEQILTRDARYHREAYMFVRDALDFTQKALGRETSALKKSRLGVGVKEEEKHVSAQELLDGIRKFALNQFGPMVITVFEAWGITGCRDFGNIVFNMVESQLLRKTANDSPKDFDGGYTFEDAFRKPYLPADKLTNPAAEPKPT